MVLKTTRHQRLHRHSFRGLTSLSAGLLGGCLFLSPTAQAASGSNNVPSQTPPSKTSHHSSSKKTTSSQTTSKNKKHHTPNAVTSNSEETLKIHYARKSRNGGGGMIRLETAPHSVQTVTKEYIAMRSPTSTALDLVQMLPSMNVSSGDNSGMQGGNISIRGLTDADMALMLNGGPTTSVHYLNEETDSENIENVSVTPGSSSLDIPTTTAAGGVMNVTQLIPSKKAGGMVDASYGTNNLNRQFIRLETGDIANTGVRSFISFSHTHARSWMGHGNSDRRHVDWGLRKDWDDGSTLTMHTSWNNEFLTEDNFPTEAQFKLNKHTGQGWGQSASHGKGQQYWRANGNKWNQIFFTAQYHKVITQRLSFDLTPYISFGQGWTADGSDSSKNTGNLYYSNGSPVPQNAELINYFQQNQSRQVGAVAKFNADLDKHNRLTFGYWYDNNLSQQTSPNNVAEPDGKAPSPNRLSNQTFYANGLRNRGKYTDSGMETHALFIQDTAHYLHNKLTIMGGLKFVMNNLWDDSVSYKATGKSYNHKGENPTEPLPQLSIGYQIDKHNQIYVNAEGDYRAPSPSSLGNITGQLPKNQYSIKEELGFRHNNKYFMIDTSFFNYNITDRLMSTCISSSLNTSGICPQTGTINAGNQTSRGFDFLIAGHAWHHFSPYASVEYLHSTIDTNVPYAGSYLPTKGIQAPLAPHVLANFGLTYDDSHFFGNFGMHYAGPQSVTLVGDQRIPGYITDNLSIGYHFKPFAYAKTPTFKLNFTNLTGSSVRTGERGLAINKNPVTLLNGKTAPGTDGANFYVTPRFTVTGSFSTNF